MGAATLNVNVVEKRILSPAEAANYCGIPSRHFQKICPVRPVLLAQKYPGYDKRDLDEWIDIEKSGDARTSHEEILGRLE